MKNTFLTLQIFRGKVTYDENGVPNSENHLMKLEHNTTQFKQFLSSAAQIGISKIRVVKATDGLNEIGLESIAEIVKQVESCVKSPEKTLSAEERVKQLEEQLAKIQAGMSTPSKPAETAGDELEQIRKQYVDVIGKKPHHLKSADVLKAEIAEKLNA